MKENKYTISEAARLLSVENHVLRYWEEELELNIPRNELGHRYYREEEIQLLHCIKELKNKGFQLKAVKEVHTGIIFFITKFNHGRNIIQR